MTKEKNVFSKIEDFEKKFPNAEGMDARREAMKTYFAYNGIIRAYESDKAWPKLTYPNIFIINRKLNEVKDKKALFQ
jgi:hypothetical protein